MLETGLLELAKGIGRLFMNPLLYWIILLFIAVSYKRIKKERLQFGTKIFPILTEAKYTIGLSLLGSFIISVFSITLGIVFTIDIAVILMVVIVVFTLTASTSFLSSSYTIGITFIVALLLPFTDLIQTQSEMMQPAYYFGLSLVLAILLLIEALLLLSKRAPSYPELIKSERGVWIGQHHLKRMAFIPFFCLFPSSMFTMELPLLPYVDIGNESYMIVLFPFVIGYHYKVLAELPQQAAKKIGKSVLFLSIIVLCLAFISIYYPAVSMVAVACAILGKEWIMFAHSSKNMNKMSVLHPMNNGLKVLTTIPDSPAERLGILIGETIVKVNGRAINETNQFYEALQNSGAFFKLEVLDTNGEVRFINSALYDTDHHELGIVFVGEPYHMKAESKTESKAESS